MLLRLLKRKFSSSFLNDFEPHSEIKIISGTCNNVHNTELFKKTIVQNENKENRDFNEVGIQMINENLNRQIFGENEKSKFHVEASVVEKYRKELHNHGIKNLKTPLIPQVDLKLPKLEGNNIEEHFYKIAESQVKEYRKLIKSLINCNLPNLPKKWIFQSGWTRYDTRLNLSESVCFPDEDSLIFDVEVCVNAGNFPVMATAVGPKYWYSWTSKKLINISKNNEKSKRLTPDDLIPMESKNEDIGYNLDGKLKKPRVVIGHNVSYDRAKIKEQYWIENTGTKFIDTMSLHVCVSGVTSYQRAMLKANKDLSEEDQNWGSLTSLNSLKEVHKLYCIKNNETKELDKEIRNVFLKGSLKEIRSDFQNLMTYCANDVIATNEIIRELYPLFEERFPHPATLAGMMEIGLAYLPINSNWIRYINEANLAYEDLDIESKTLLSQRADQACRLKHNSAYKNNLWMWDQDWSEQDLKLKKGKVKLNENNTSITASKNEELNYLEKLFKPLQDKKYLLPARRPLLPGYPLWYRNLCEKQKDSISWTPGVIDIGTGMQIAPKLLSLCWEGYPLHFIRGEGWGFLMPTRKIRPNNETGSIPLEALLEKCPLHCRQIEANENESNEAMVSLWKDVERNISKKNFYNKKGKKYMKANVEDFYKGSGVWCNIELENCCWFFKLPHKDGKSKNVGNPLAKDFINKFSENVLTGEGHIAERVIEIARMLSYWRNNRDRIMGQMAVWLNTNCLPKNLALDEMEYGAIIPQVVVSGTLTRRAMEPTWMTASNSKIERVGSELRGMVQAPEGYKIVGADVDSQELWIASLLGDSERRIHGSTPFGWMTLSGTKVNGTDLHTITANAVGISRDHAKVINYARIYGAGQNFAQTLLRQFNPSISDNEAKSKAIKMFSLTKGKKVYFPIEEYRDEYETQKGFSSYEAMRIASLNGKSIREVFSKAQWIGGSESAMFNKLEEIAENCQPVTPFLHCRLSRALEPQSGMEDRFLPTRINWVVQSGAVDFLHLMLVCMRWLMGDKIRFCLSFHDEIRYIVKDEHANHAALAMHVTNLLTRSFCASRLGFKSLPQSIAFFTSVEIDRILRKEAENDCKTPSNQHGFSGGYSIKPGESVDIYEAIKRVGNDLSSWTK